MSLLDNMPHTATARIRTRTTDSIGGAKDSFANVSGFVDRSCWQQTASEAEILEFAKRGISVTDKVYFALRPAIDERHLLIVTNVLTGQTDTYEVRTYADPDAGAGLGRVYRVMVEQTTTGSTP